MLLPAVLTAGDPPLQPDPATARQWLLDELGKPVYQAAKPNWFDRASAWFWDWLSSLLTPGTGGWPPLLIVLVSLLALGLIVAGFLIFGAPRRRRRLAPVGGVVADSAGRDAKAIRRSAAAAAGSGDWTLAVEEAFRALATSFDERTIISLSPGTTAREAAAVAGAAFSDAADELAVCAMLFEQARYLGRPGAREGYERILSLDETLRSRRTVLGVRAG